MLKTTKIDKIALKIWNNKKYTILAKNHLTTHVYLLKNQGFI